MHVEVLCLRGKGEARLELVDGVTVRRLPVTHRRGAPLLRVLGEYVLFTVLPSVVLALRRRRPDLVQVHAPPDFLPAAALPPRFRGSRIKSDVHDLSPHMYEARFASRCISRSVGAVLRAIERSASPMSDRVITVH